MCESSPLFVYTFDSQNPQARIANNPVLFYESRQESFLVAALFHIFSLFARKRAYTGMSLLPISANSFSKVSIILKTSHSSKFSKKYWNFRRSADQPIVSVQSSKDAHKHARLLILRVRRYSLQLSHVKFPEISKLTD